MVLLFVMCNLASIGGLKRKNDVQVKVCWHGDVSSESSPVLSKKLES